MTATPQVNACPYCHAVRDKPFVRKTRCKSCGNYVYGRTAALDTIGRQGVTEKETHIFQFWSEIMYMLGLTPSHYKSAEKALKMRFPNKKITPRSVVWAVSNSESLFKKATAALDLASQVEYKSAIEFARARFIANHDEKDPIETIHTAIALYLKSLTLHEFRPKDVLIQANECCITCQKFNGVKRNLDKEIKQPLLPQRMCTKKVGSANIRMCTCTYYPAFEMLGGDYDYHDSSHTPEALDTPVKSLLPGKKKSGFLGLFK